MTARKRLPNRRHAETFELTVGGLRGGHCDGVTDADRRSARAANGSRAANHQCDHCGLPGASGQWNWPGWPDGIWLHPRCEGPWLDSEGGARCP